MDGRQALSFDDSFPVGENRSSPLSGPVAQLGARFHGMEEVVGSIPTRSTNLFNQLPSFLSDLFSFHLNFDPNVNSRFLRQQSK